MKIPSPSLLFFLLFHLVVGCPFSAKAQPYKNMSLGTTLTPLGPNNSWPSPSSDFAFGFLPLPANTSLFLLAVWFVKNVNNIIVWTANGNTPVLAGSKLQLTTNGQFSLTDPSGKTIWTRPQASGFSHAAMLDTGNLVVVSEKSGDVAWQSFDEPTDTILPTQVLGHGAQLRSRFSNTNYSSGRFMLLLQNNGNLALHTVATPTAQVYEPYWVPTTNINGSKLVFSPSGAVYLMAANGTQISITSVSIGSMEDFYQRATLDTDGVFRYYIRPKNQNATSWEEGWTPKARVPDDICHALEINIGSGTCGFNSYCQNDANQTPRCLCPSNYSFVNPNDMYEGCEPDFTAQSCDMDDMERFQFTAITDTDWPRSDYAHFTNVTEDQCRDYCLKDCFCAVAAFRNGECWKKKMPLSNGRSGFYVGGQALIKVAKDGSLRIPVDTAATRVEKKNQKSLVIVGSSLLGASSLFFIWASVMLFCNKSKIKRHFLPRTKRKNQNLQSELNMSGLTLRPFTYEELHAATNGFSEELGRGAFGTVYEGFLDEGKLHIAVKKLDKLFQETEKEFIAEVRSIGQTHHKNLVNLFGYCNEGANRLLVYEFMSNGSLTSFLFGDTRPGWNKRLQIIAGVARGLRYLHEECSTPIIHCDIKTQNILLDDNLVARISDFGLAKLLRADQTRTNTGIRGTRGYVAPEWFRNTPITPKVDVYSFGVLLLEIICCRRNLELETRPDEEAVLVYWAWDCYREGRADLLVAGDEDAMGDGRVVQRLVMVALWCLQEDPGLRPSMQKVVQMLEGSVVVALPPDPYSSAGPFRL